MHLPQDALVREMAGGAYKVGLPLWPAGNRNEEAKGCWMWDFERRTSQLRGPAVVVVAVGRGDAPGDAVRGEGVRGKRVLRLRNGRAAQGGPVTMPWDSARGLLKEAPAFLLNPGSG